MCVVSAGFGVVEGGAIPYLSARRKRKKTLKLEPEVKWFMPRLPRATYFPFPISDQVSRPLKISVPLYRRIEKNMQLDEFKCVDLWKS